MGDRHSLRLFVAKTSLVWACTLNLRLLDSLCQKGALVVIFFFWFSALLGRFVRPISPFITFSGSFLQFTVILLHHPVQQHHSRSSSCLLPLHSSLNYNS